MAKTKAQRMKEYRERKKALLGDEWLKKERERVRVYKPPIAELSIEEQEHKRKMNRKHCDTYRKKRKLAYEEEASPDIQINENNDSTITDDCNGVSSTTFNMSEPLTVKINFNKPESSRKSRGRKRVSRALAKQYRLNEKLEEENDSLRRKLNSTRKRLNRLELKHKQETTAKPLTPRGKANKLMEENGIDPAKAPKIKQKLVFAECLTDEIKDAISVNDTNIVKPIIYGKKMKKYRLKNKLGHTIGIDRRKLVGHKKLAEIRKRRRNEEINNAVNRDIKEFLEREDNSRLLPGKSDAVKVGKNRVQKRVLNDYMYNLYDKFLAESTYKISLATMYRKKPPSIAYVNFSTRSVCLCQKHQNFALKLRSLKNYKITSVVSPDKFMKIFSTEEALVTILEDINASNVRFQEWKRQKMKDEKERMRVVDIELPKTEFVEIMKQQYREFASHIDRVHKQYQAVKMMKEKLPRTHAIVQMDFAENYSCQTLEEVQSAYWNSSAVTLHPTVIYKRNNNNELEHQSVVFVSEVLNHNAAMVTVITDKVIELTRDFVDNLEAIHFWTDSPTSQYRNKTIFNYINKLCLKNIKSSWQFFESGHGKGPCDGIGGTTKRNADNAVKKGVIIQDAEEFFRWASTSDSTIKYVKVNEEEYNESVKRVEENIVKPIKGTMKIHSVVSNEKGFILTRDTTCACDKCFDYEIGFREDTLCLWSKHQLELKRATVACQETDNQKLEETKMKQEKQSELKESNTDTNNNEVRLTKTNEPELKWKEDDYVVVLYDQQCYIGQVTDIDEDENEVEVNCMEKCNKIEGRYKWPSKEDKIWLNYKHILKVIPMPTATAKSKRMFNVDGETSKFIETYNA